MASPTSACLFQQPVSVQCVLSETLTGIWLDVFNDGDFASKSVAPPSDELDDPPCLLGLLYPVEDCLGDGQFDRCSHCSGTVHLSAFLRSGSGSIWSCALALGWLLVTTLNPLVGVAAAICRQLQICWTLSLVCELLGYCWMQAFACGCWLGSLMILFCCKGFLYLV